MLSKKILITGGAGFIAAHTIVMLIEAGYQVVIIDNFVNSDMTNIQGIHKITGVSPILYEGSIGDKALLTSIFSEHAFDGVIHFAGLKAVGESCSKPFLYYENNLSESLVLFSTMEEFKVRKIVFSSSATVYAEEETSPLSELARLGTTNPYGTTKLCLEYILKDLSNQLGWQVTLLRYFNPIGAHQSGYIGEIPRGTPNNLLPYLMQVAIGARSHVSVFGADYETIDGTGVRDYIDVNDLSRAHLLAYTKSRQGCSVFNVGTGVGTSVLQMIQKVSQVTKKDIPYVLTNRRPGDKDVVFCDASKIAGELGFFATISIEESIAHAYSFYLQHHS